MASETTTASSLKTTDYSYDALGRLDIQTDTDQSGNTLAEYDYTVRPDGKRTELTEEFWFDDDGDGVVESTDGDGNVDPGETKTTTYDWTYDAAGRLTDEVLDHWDDDDLDRTETFVYDLTGNRHSRTVDHVDAAVNDEFFTYDYDANDRLDPLHHGQAGFLFGLVLGPVVFAAIFGGGLIQAAAFYTLWAANITGLVYGMICT